MMSVERLAEIREKTKYLRRIGHQRIIQEELLQAFDESVETERLRCRRIAEGCHDYSGGHTHPHEAKIYHQGIDAVVNALEAYSDREEQRLAKLGLIGAGIIDPARGTKRA